MTDAAYDEVAVDPARRREVIRQGLSVGFATGLYGVSFGALSVASGLDVWQTQALSLLLFSGGSQFAVVGVLGAGGSGVAAVATSTLLGIRNGLYGLQVARFLEARGLRRMLAAHVTIDESTAVGIAQEEPRLQRLGFWVTGLGVLVMWNLLTLACALLWPRLRSGEARASAVLAGFIALLTTPLLPPGVPVILAAFAAVIIGWRPIGAHEVPPTAPPPGLDPTP